MSDDRTRASLLVRLRDADSAAWGAFVGQYGPLIRDWCRLWSVQPADADDLTQIVMAKLAALLQRFEYDPTKRFRGLLRTITRRAWLDLIDEQRRAVAGSGDSAVLAVLNTVEASEDLSARIEAAFDRELVALASEVVRQRVEPHTWEAFRLTAIEGRNGAEVATALNMRVGSVYKARSKVQQMLREEIDRLEEESSCPRVLPPPTSAPS